MRRSSLAIGLTLSLITTALAQSGGDFNIPRSSIDAGGGLSSGGNLQLYGSIGQPDAAPELTGNGFTLRGGLLVERETAPMGDAIFYDGFE